MQFTRSLLFAREGKGGGGVSLEPEDKISVGIFGPGEASIVESVFADYNYGGKSKAVPVWLITYERDGEKYEQPYSVGSGWRVSSDGESLVPKNGQTGLPDSCNAMLMLESLREAGFPKGKLGNNPRVLEGMSVLLRREAQPDRGLDADRLVKGGSPKAPRTILLIEEIKSLPWEASRGNSSKAKKSRDEEEEEETPKRSAKSKARDEEEEDEDEKPTKGKKTTAKTAKSDDEDIEEAAVEAIIEACEKAGEPIDVDDLEGLVLKALKGNPERAEIAEKAVEIVTDEKGWTFNKKRNTVESEG